MMMERTSLVLMSSIRIQPSQSEEGIKFSFGIDDHEIDAPQSTNSVDIVQGTQDIYASTSDTPDCIYISAVPIAQDIQR